MKIGALGAANIYRKLKNAGAFCTKTSILRPKQVADNTNNREIIKYTDSVRRSVSGI